MEITFFRGASGNSKTVKSYSDLLGSILGRLTRHSEMIFVGEIPRLGYSQVWTAPIQEGWHDTYMYVYIYKYTYLLRYIHMQMCMCRQRERDDFRGGYVRFGDEIGQDVHWMNGLIRADKTD